MFDNAVFAAGGSRCFWQLGFWVGANEAGLDLAGTVSYAASTSAGCAIAAAALLGREREALDGFKALSAQNPANIHWRNLFRGTGAPLLPHTQMYRGVLQTFLDEADLAALSAKNLDCLIAKNPAGMPGGLAALFGFTIYGLEKRLTQRIHPQWSRRLGFRPLVASSRDATSVDDLVDMVMAASCVPPVLPSPPFRGQAVLDGGMIDNVPAFLADGRTGRTLVLLSKRYQRPLPEIAGRTYVQPSQHIRIDKFDYANPEGLQEAFDLGMDDGSRFADTASE